MPVVLFSGSFSNNRGSTDDNVPKLPRVDCSQTVSNIMEANQSKICQNMPISVMRQKLVEYSVIEEDSLQQTNESSDDDNEMANLILEKLENSGDRGFYIFCNILKEQSDEQLRLLGFQLSDEAKQTMGLSNDDLLRNVPPLPQHHFIVRNDFANQTAIAIMKIHASGGRLLVHGPSGTGKTVAVSNSLQYVIRQKEQFLPHGVYWVKIGKVDEQKLFEILYNLATKLRIKPQTFPNLKKLNQAISSHFVVNSDLSFTLFVFDEVEESSYLNYLTFAKNCVVISTQSNQAMVEKFDYITQSQASFLESFTQQEASQIIASFQESGKTEPWINDDVVKKVVEKYRSSPQAIALIGGTQLSSLDEWLDIQKFTESEPVTTFSHTFFTMVMNKLPTKTRELFSLLGVCYRVEIPISTVAIIWNLPVNEVSVILQELHRRSLLFYFSSSNKRAYCQINNLILDYFQQPSNSTYVSSEFIRNLHLNVINRYQLHCDENWIIQNDDGYFYRYFINHLMAAEKDDIIQQILSNVEWINNLLQLLKQSSLLYAYLDHVQDYLSSKNLDSTSKPLEFLRKYEIFLQGSCPDLLQLILDFAPSDNPLYQQAYESAYRLSEEGKGLYMKLSYTQSRKADKFYDIQNLPKEEDVNLMELVIERGNTYTPFEGRIYQFAESFDHKIKARGFGPRYGMNLYQYSWDVISVEEGLQLPFILQNGEKAIHLEACTIQFLEKSNTSFMTISAEKHQLHVWTLENLQPISKITVPARINSSLKPLTGKPDPSNHLISYVGHFDDSRYLISYGGLGGLLSIKDCQDKTEKDFADHWSKMFKIIHNNYTHLAISKDKKYLAVLTYFGDVLIYQVSADEVIYYSFIECQFGSSQIFFVDDSYNIMADFGNSRLYYTFPTTQKSMPPHRLANADRNCNSQVPKQKIVNNALVLVEMIKDDDELQLKVHRGDRLEEVTFHNFGSHYKSTFMSKDHSTVDFFLFDDFPYILLIEVYGCNDKDCLKDQNERHFHCFQSLRRFDDLDHDLWVNEVLVNDFKYKEFQPLPEEEISPFLMDATPEQTAEIQRYSFLKNARPNIKFQSLYRQYDNQVMIMITESRRLIILFMNATNGVITAKHVEEINESTPEIAYLADENFVLYDESNEQEYSDDERFFTKYSMQAGNIHAVQRVKAKICDEEEMPVSSYCKMTISDDNKDVQLTDILLVDDDDKIKEQFGLTDWRISKMEKCRRVLGVLIRKGNQALVSRKPWQGSYNQATFYAGDRKIYCESIPCHLPHLWDKKYTITTEGNGIEFYDNATLQLKKKYSPTYFSNEYITSVQASPDGKIITFTQPHGCLNIIKAIF
ncbi:Apoptotic protease-activating factor 1 [Trichoplax sp. H2]|nr:Apoptotic protease-activating factor 1 [Trichoplax sp. H2]|eukprot:RDD41636.1 Apoptotic protease-activating factor 1 [Trichoplax sp. H2]